MTHKEYRMLASVIESIYAKVNSSFSLSNPAEKAAKQSIVNVAVEIANACKQDNYRFDHRKFYTACGIKELT